ncbi:MAG: DEAD/DEAH box helicase [Thermomicrobiales bacterium]
MVSDIDVDAAYARLHPKIRQWIWDQEWQQLWPIQARAVAPVLAGEDDVIINAATAGGKTEAAWMPIVSALAFQEEAETAVVGVKALAVIPLKALINDQYDRLHELAGSVEIPLHRRHGDVSGAERGNLLKRPDGILLITPESLEALFVNHGSRMPSLFLGLRYVLIDELHSFIGTERGAQLQSLLHRLELVIRRRVPRIALSATLADPRIAADFLRPGRGDDVVIVGGTEDDTAEIRMQMRGYVYGETKSHARNDAGHLVEGFVTEYDPAENPSIAEHLFTHLRGKDNLVFTNARRVVEIYAALLQSMSEAERVPNEFYPHHGNLSREYRGDVERMLKASDQHATAICTSTLEMGIDIGTADSIAQIGAPNSVSALRQRLGRSGRRGQPAVLRLYITEDQLTAHSSPIDQVRAEIVQSVAVVELLLAKWYEPPLAAGLHLSTLVQQILSVIAQHGGATAPQLFSALCADGPFSHVDRRMFIRLLRDLGAYDIVGQASDGLLLPGGEGERLLNAYAFYTAFQTPDEYRLMSGGDTLGTMPVEYPLVVGQLIVFAGRRWKVLTIDSREKVVELAPSGGGRAARFGGGRAEIADGIRRKMQELYERDDVPVFLDKIARRLLKEGRAKYRLHRLTERSAIDWDGDTLLFPWRGDRIMNTLAMLLLREGVNVSLEGVALICRDESAARVRKILRQIGSRPLPDALTLAANAHGKERDKYDQYLSEELLTASCAARDLDLPGAREALQDLLAIGHRAVD